MSVPTPPLATPLARLFGRGGVPGGPVGDLHHLLERICVRLYPETIPVVASWWLKTVYAAGHNRVWWSQLDAAIGRALRAKSLDATAAEALRDIRQWIGSAILSRHKTPDPRPLVAPPFRDDLAPEQAAPYLARALNEWLPADVARLLTESDEEGMPPLVVAKAIEALLLRERFSPATLELLLDSAWTSPVHLYPAHAEIFADVVLAFLGRTAAAAPPTLPALALVAQHAGALDRATLDRGALHVPLDQTEALDWLQHDPVRPGSIVVTVDGRWWRSVRLQTTPETGTLIVYRPGGRLRIDFAADHARLAIPWPDPDPHWSGEIHLPERLALFGREWRGRAWERSTDRTWLHLEFAAALTLPDASGAPDARPHRLRPASTEMAWSEVEQALATGNPAAPDQLRREELIPLAHALLRLTDAVARPWPSREAIDQALTAVRYHHGAVEPVFGRIPWRVLPPWAAAALRKRDPSPLTQGVFEDPAGPALRVA